MATTSAIKTNLQSVVYQRKFIRHTNTNAPWCLFANNNISFTPEEAMLVSVIEKLNIVHFEK